MIKDYEDHHWNPIKCKPFQGLLSARACALNLEMAGNAYQMLRDGVSLFLIDDLEIDRLAHCSRCKLAPTRMRMDGEDLLLKSMRGLIDKVIQWDEYGHDPELMDIRKKERAARYRESHREEIKDKKRINYLKRQMEKIREGGEDGG